MRPLAALGHEQPADRQHQEEGEHDGVRGHQELVADRATVKKPGALRLVDTREQRFPVDLQILDVGDLHRVGTRGIVARTSARPAIRLQNFDAGSVVP